MENNSMSDLCRLQIQKSGIAMLNGQFETFFLVAAFFSIISMNSILLFGLYKTNNIKNYTSKLLIIISIEELIIAITTIPMHLMLANGVFPWKYCNCIFGMENVIWAFLGLSNSLLTLGIGIDRYIIVKKPFQYKRWLKSKHGFALYLVLTYTTTFLVTMMLECTIAKDSLKMAIVHHYILLGLLILILCGSLLVNVSLVVYIRAQANLMRQLSDVNVKIRYKKRATQTVTYISVLHIFTYIPLIAYFIYNLTVIQAIVDNSLTMDVDTHLSNERYIVYIWLRMPMFFFSGINAFIFLYRNNNIVRFYKSSLKSLLKINSS